ncbi:MAG: ParB/RepB/Spo0J family partition protein [Candidatus Paceibacterota bacterium]
MNTTQHVSIDAIDDPRIAMRGNVHDEEIDQLMSDMKEVGLVEPIVVRRVGERFEIIAGHRRTTAARLLNWPTIEAKIVEADDNEALRMRAIENTSRLDVNPVDDAAFCHELMTRAHMTVDEVAGIRNRSVAWVESRLQVYNMPTYLQEYVGQKRIALGSALWITKLEPETKRQYYANWAALNGISISGAKRWYDMMLAEGGLQNVDDSQIGDVAHATGKFVPHTICKACGEDKPLDDLENIWVCRGLTCQEPSVDNENVVDPTS